MVRYEALRAGLEPRLVLAVIDVESGFRKYAVSTAGARGYMQVMPFWVREIGMPGQNLFHARTNLRYGCVILRHYLTIENGDYFRALGRYNGSLGKAEYPQLVHRAWMQTWRYEQEPMRERARMYEEDPQLVKNIIADGCERARKLANETMRDVREAIGLDYS